MAKSHSRKKVDSREGRKEQCTIVSFLHQHRKYISGHLWDRLLAWHTPSFQAKPTLEIPEKLLAYDFIALWLSLYERAEEGDIAAVQKMFQSQFASASKLFPKLLMKQDADEVVSLFVIFLLSASEHALEVFARELPNLSEIQSDLLFGMYPTVGPSVHGAYRSFYTFTLDNGFGVVNQAIGSLICENINKVEKISYRTKKDDLKTPDIIMFIPNNLLIYDNFSDSLYIIKHYLSDAKEKDFYNF